MSHEQRAAIIEAMRNAPQSEDQSVAGQRASFDSRFKDRDLGEGVSVRRTTLGGVPVVDITVAGTEGDGVILYIHGGGYVVGSANTGSFLAAALARRVGVRAVSVEYRLAPENPFPAGLDDCYAALLWTAASADDLGIDLSRLAVGGDSAGGGLAAAVALLARDRGGPALCFQYLGIPELDDRLDTPSMLAYDDTPLWHRPAAEFSWDSYLGPGVRGTEDVSPYAAPARMADLSGLPPAFVNVCQFDPLRDEGIAFAQRLAQANVPTELVLYPGTFHGSGMIAASAVTKRIISDQLAALRRALHTQVTQPVM